MRPLVVFDLDGTIVDSRRDLADSTNELLESFGAPRLPDADVVAMVGEGARMLVSRAIRAAGLAGVGVDDALARFRAIYDRRLLAHTRPYEGIPAVLRWVKEDSAVAVLTNKPEDPSRRLLDAFELTPYVDWVIGGDSGFSRKPDPAGLLHLIATAGAVASRAAMVGDSWIDVETGQRAGVRVCGVTYGFGGTAARGLTGADWIVDSPADIVNVLASFLDRH